MKVQSFTIRLLALFAASLPVALLYLATSNEAAVSGAELSESQMAEIQQLLIDKDPKLLLDRHAQALHLTEGEVNALLGYFAHTVPELRSVASSVALEPGSATLGMSAPLDAIPFRAFLNLELSVTERDSRLSIERLAVGRLGIPGVLAEPLLGIGRTLLADDANYRLLASIADTVEGVTLMDGAMELRLDWAEEDLAAIGREVQSVFIDDEERTRLLRYYSGIGEVAGAVPAGRTSTTLNHFFRPLFRSAARRSAAGADPVAENRAIFVAMSIYLNGIALEQLTGAADGTPQAPRRLQVKVGPREDLAQHIVTSAAIAASAGAAVADILSVYKEVHDSRYRTGFSFSDLTANQVGAALGQLATRDMEHARLVQDFLAESREESDYMPPVDRFDGITEQEFINQYQDRSSDHYRERLRQIDEAIAARPLFQALDAFRTPPLLQ